MPADFHIFRSLEEAAGAFGPCALTIGNFDGVHVGHRHILRRVREVAEQNNWKASVMMFDPHPTRVVAPARAPLVIAQAEQSDAASTGRLARDPDSLLAKTLDIKDHVVGAARNVVSAIGDVIGTVGGHLIGANLESAPPARQFSSAS